MLPYIYNIEYYLKYYFGLEYILAFFLLYILLLSLFKTTNIIHNNKAIQLISITISLIALYNPITTQIIFSIIPNMTVGILILFALIVVFFMASKIEIVDNEIKYTLKKISKYIVYGVLAFAVIYGYKMLVGAGLIPNFAYYNIGGIVFLAGFLGLMYYIIIKPIKDTQSKTTTHHNLKSQVEEMHKAHMKAKQEMINELIKKGMSPQEAAYWVAEMEKSKHH